MSGTDLYAGGDFTTAGGVPANSIAKWNGSTWSALGSGMNYSVGALAVLGTDLYVGGYFTSAGDKVSAYVAKGMLTPPSGPPAIVSQPSNQTVDAGGSAWFSVMASGGLPLFYQWRFYGTNLAGQTNTTLALSGVTTNQAGPYTAVVTNASGSVTSAVATLTVLAEPPLIVAQPTNQIVTVGGTVTSAVVATGNLPLSYQWRWYGTNLPDQTSTSLVLAGVTTSQAGPYTVVVTNAYGSATSFVATLTVLTVPPLIVTQPTNQTVGAGGTATFTVTASGSPPLSYQWRWHGTNLPSQTSTSLVLAGVTTNHAGPYTVVVTNAYGSVTSSVATLTVIAVLTLSEALDAPELTWTTGGTAAWTAQTSVTHDGVDAAQSGTISHSQETWVQTSVVGPGPLAFWWKVSSESGYDYLEFYTNSVLVTRIAGEVNWQQLNYTLGAGTHVLRWRYMKDGSVSSGQDRGWLDQVAFTPPTGPPVIATQPTNQTVQVGGTATFAVTASGALPLSYQWRWYGTNLPSQTSTSLVLAGVTTNHAGPYTVVVTNAYGSVTSSVATLTVIPGLTLGEALDAPELTWTTGGTAAWTAQTSVTHDGVDAAQSGTISDNQETWVETSVVGPGPLSFWWKVSSESSYEYLEFYTNSTLVTRISGEVNWQQLNYALGAGTHVLRWRYMKDSSVSSGQDRGWLDQVQFVPTGPTPPQIVQQPTNHVAGVGGTATFNVTAVGTAPLSYRWHKNGLALTDGGNVTGAATNTLTLSNVQSSDMGNYTVVVTNAHGSVTSAVATLTVSQPGVAPSIIVQPQSRTNEAGTTASFSVVATGSEPLSYQWRFYGTNLPGQIGTNLVLANVTANQAGPYTVVVTNANGAVTSSVATLTVVTGLTLGEALDAPELT